MAKDDQNFWNFWLLVLSLVLLAVEVWIVVALDRVPVSIGIFDFILISLATFRLTRLFVYDTIMQFVRDWFLIRKVSHSSEGELVVDRKKPADGVRRAMADLFSCPWCFGMQAAILVVFFYYLSDWSWIVILMLAVGGVATFVQLCANAIGWRAENLKRVTEKNYPDEEVKGKSAGTCG